MALALLALLAPACAGYSERTREARQAVARGDLQRALVPLNAALGVDSADALPERWRGDRPLVALERAVLLQALGEYAKSARDFEAADRELELLDLAADPMGAAARYVASESAPRYRSTPTEKLALPALNLLNYLARGDLSGAAVEARRFTVMREYLLAYDPEHAWCAFGSYLAGVVFERLGEPGRARRYYQEARVADAPAAATPADGVASAEVLVVAAVGRVPHKVPRRMPIGRAVALAGAYVTRDLSWLAFGAFKSVRYAGLAPSGSLFSGAEVRIDGRPSAPAVSSDLAAEVRREYERLEPRILAAAVTRLIARAAAAEGARRAVREGAEAERWVAWLVSALTEGALLAADRPDTRSWSLLPGRVVVARERVAPGPHRVEVALTGSGRETRVFDVAPGPGELATVVWVAPR